MAECGAKPFPKNSLKHISIIPTNLPKNPTGDPGHFKSWPNVLKEYPLDVSTQVSNHYDNAATPPTAFQFRLQFTGDANVEPNLSDLENNMWNVFSVEDPTDNGNYVPKLELTYTIEDK